MMRKSLIKNHNKLWKINKNLMKNLKLSISMEVMKRMKTLKMIIFNKIIIIKENYLRILMKFKKLIYKINRFFLNCKIKKNCFLMKALFIKKGRNLILKILINSNNKK